MSTPAITLDLPMPPSVNRIWRAHKAGKHRISLSPEYDRWKREADMLALSTGQLKDTQTILGPFEAHVVLKRVRGDLDNRHKGLMDWLQSRAVIANDGNCVKLTVEWGDAPAGCRVMVTERPL